MSLSSRYETPLSTRYASQEMSYLFSPVFKYTTWRSLWIALAKGEKRLGLPITEAQIKELEAQKKTLNLKQCLRYEKQFRHDVMAHIHAYGKLCPKARAIIHLGATSSFVTDNTDLIQMQQGLKLLLQKFPALLRALFIFAKKHASLPCLSFTHLQPAQPTTVGKRASLWLQDFLLDFQELQRRCDELPFLGVKGATGSQASFLTLFQGDEKRVEALDRYVTKAMGFAKSVPLSSQTYSRKWDQLLVSSLASFATSAHKMASDIRLLAHLKEVEEPFLKSQVGSSAMPYKQNPHRSERICSLARYLISLSENPAYTAAAQWLERSLDDSANRRCSLPESFLCADALCNELIHLTRGLTVSERFIKKHLEEEIPFLALENILMESVKRGKERQTIHECLRSHALKAKEQLKKTGILPDLLGALAQDPQIALSDEEIKRAASESSLVGLAPSQVMRFLNEEIAPLLASLPPLKVKIPDPQV
ncbi:MAG TPA: adenylosuccinate lyase [Parachlamydiales bacterium]|nr:MAG: adenylosuccinate lyase [Chlamydiae bacterium GWA2_50_15]OGN68179.1 MAG: adenylosuccinate lyase [Chlamydiae bacterium RIFCSPLOWO2_02_FULL_49_12]HAZ15111.1 adenylosuccinate lyase [Parachlamydiales bacterium]